MPEFSDDYDALKLLKSHGYRETANGVLRGDWRAMNEGCRAAVRYLCDEWDFMFLDEPPKEGE